MKKQRPYLSALLLSATVTSVPVSLADDDDDEIEFDEARIFFELNNTDGDLGIHALIDGEPWRRLTIEDPRERTILNIRANGRLRRQGLTEIFFESAEPTFDELLPEAFFERFPQGEYEIEGRTLERQELESEVEVTHLIPAPPEPTVNGTLLELRCDRVEVVPVVSTPVVISWDPVTLSHPFIGIINEPLDIKNYELVVEVEDDGFESTFSVVVPPEVTTVTLPNEFIDQGNSFKYELLARETSDNQTATECFFEVM